MAPTFTTAEKLQFAMLCELAKPANKRELDFEFIWEAIMNDDLWALDWRYPGLQLKAGTPPEVSYVCDVLDMWERIEQDFMALHAAEQARVIAESYHSGGPNFLGFSGNDETGLMHIARLLVNDLDRWSHFKGRDFNSHFPSVETYDRLLSAWRPIWDKKVKSGNYRVTPDEMILVLRENIHPEHRVPAVGSGWTFDPTKFQS